MPKPKKQTNQEFQSAEFPARIAAVRAKANAALKADKKHSPMLSVKERGRHEEALRAADRVESRMKNPSGGKKKPKAKAKAKSTPATRQRAVEKATGQDKTTDRIRAVNELAEAAAKKK